MIEAELHNAKEALSAALLEKETLAKDLRNAKDLLKKHEHNIAELHKDITHAKGKYEQSIDQLSASEANLQAVKDELDQCRKQQQSLKDEVLALKEQLAQYMNGPARDWTHAVKSGKNQQNVHSTRQDETPPEDRVLKDNVSFPTSTRNTTGGQRRDLDLLILGNSHVSRIDIKRMYPHLNCQSVSLEEKNISGATKYMTTYEGNPKAIVLQVISNDLTQSSVDTCLNKMQQLVDVCTKRFPSTTIFVGEPLPRRLQYREQSEEYKLKMMEMRKLLPTLKGCHITIWRVLHLWAAGLTLVTAFTSITEECRSSSSA